VETSAKTQSYRVECHYCQVVGDEKYYPVVGLDFGNFAILIKCPNKEIFTTVYMENYYEYSKDLEECFMKYCQDGRRKGSFLEVEPLPEQAEEIKNIIESPCGIDYDKLFHAIGGCFFKQLPKIPIIV